MPTSTGAKRGPKPKPAALKRSGWLKVRANPLEEQAAAARAQAAGLTLSDYIRRQVCGMEPERTAEEARRIDRGRTAERRAPGDFDALVARYSRTMPRRSAEILAKRELARS